MLEYDGKLQQNEEEIELMMKEIEKELNFNQLLDKYGPEGLYKIADRLKEIADNDVRSIFK